MAPRNHSKQLPQHHRPKTRSQTANMPFTPSSHQYPPPPPRTSTNPYTSHIPAPPSISCQEGSPYQRLPPPTPQQEQWITFLNQQKFSTPPVSQTSFDSTTIDNCTVAAVTDNIQTTITPTKAVEHKEPTMKYIYPPISKPIIKSIGKMMRSNPDFYTNVLHLMNKMRLPPPFKPPSAVAPKIKTQTGSHLTTQSSSTTKSTAATTPDENPTLAQTRSALMDTSIFIKPSSKESTSSTTTEFSIPDSAMQGINSSELSESSPSRRIKLNNNKKKKRKAILRKQQQKSKALGATENVHPLTPLAQNRIPTREDISILFSGTAELMHSVEQSWKSHLVSTIIRAERSPRALERWSKNLAERVYKADENLTQAASSQAIMEAGSKLEKARVAYEVGQRNILMVAGAVKVPLAFTILPSALEATLARVPKRRRSSQGHSSQSQIINSLNNRVSATDESNQSQAECTRSKEAALRAVARAGIMAEEAAVIAEEMAKIMAMNVRDVTVECATSSSPPKSIADENHIPTDQIESQPKLDTPDISKPPASILYKESMFDQDQRPSKWVSGNSRKRPHTSIYRFADDEDSDIDSRERDCHWMFGDVSDSEDEATPGVISWGKKRTRIFKKDDICGPSAAAMEAENDQDSKSELNSNLGSLFFGVPTTEGAAVASTSEGLHKQIDKGKGPAMVMSDSSGDSSDERNDDDDDMDDVRFERKRKLKMFSKIISKKRTKLEKLP
ncbi:RNA-binding region-containing protein 3 [Mortierella sp. AM989]|nr:RNA-binding region-containing protein 3 [Mortierella sp. AM989]